MIISDINKRLNDLPNKFLKSIQENPNKHYHEITIKGHHGLSKKQLTQKINKIIEQITTQSKSTWYHHFDYMKNIIILSIYDNHDKSLYDEIPNSDIFNDIIDPDLIPDDICPF